MRRWPILSQKKIAPDNLFYLYLLRKIGPPTCGCSSRSDGPFILVEGNKEKKWEWKVTVIFSILFASSSFYLLHYLGLPTCDCSRWSDSPFCPRKKKMSEKKNCPRKKNPRKLILPLPVALSRSCYLWLRKMIKWSVFFTRLGEFIACCKVVHQKLLFSQVIQQGILRSV